MGYRRFLRYIVDADVVRCCEQQVDDRLGPVGTIAQESKVGQRLFWAAKLSLFLAQFVRELDQELAIAVPLMLRKRQDTRDVVIIRRLLFFRKVSNDMAPR